MNMHEKILDNLQELVYIADMETYELLYYNRALAEEFHIPQRLHGKCYEILQGRRDPCPFCTNGKLSQDGCYVWKFYNQLVGRHFLLSDSICEFNGRQVRTEIASDITEHVLLQEQLDKNLSLQNFINHCARKLYRQDADLPFLIDDVLAAIGEYLQADRAYIFEFSDDVVRNTFEWCREGVVPQKEFLANVPVGVIARWMPNFYAHQPILITDLESLRVSSPEEYAVLKRQDIHSLLVFPLWNGKSLRGFVGVDNLDPERIDSSRVLLSSMKFFLSSSLWRRDSLNELHFLSYHDQLTGVFNRNAFQRDVQKRDADIGVIFLDINGLKDINDGDGYSGGDAVLAAVSRSVHELLPDTAVYRMGGDEFVLLWQGGDEREFRRDVERVRSLFAGTLGFTASVGCAWVRHEDDIGEGLIAADARMFAAKRDFYRSSPQSGRYRSGLDDVLAFDTGPGNMVMDAVTARLTDGAAAYDAGGALAAQGQVSEKLLRHMLNDPYLAQRPPKTTGRERYGAEYTASLCAYAGAEGIRLLDVLATATRFTAECIAAAVRDYAPEPPARLIVGGGGALNAALMQHIRQLLPACRVMTNEELGFDGNAKEALAFAILANEAIFAHANNVPSVTGAKHPVVMGKISL